MLRIGQGEIAERYQEKCFSSVGEIHLYLEEKYSQYSFVAQATMLEDRPRRDCEEISTAVSWQRCPFRCSLFGRLPVHEEKAILGERHGEICGFAWRKICWKRAVVDEVTVSFCRQGCIKGSSYSLSENVADLVISRSGF